MLDRDLAPLYQVTTGRLNEAVKRNKDCFPKDFMFQLTKEEWSSLKSQIAISNVEAGSLKSQNAFQRLEEVVIELFHTHSQKKVFFNFHTC